MNKGLLIFSILFLSSLVSAAVTIGQDPDYIRGVVIWYPEPVSSSSSGNVSLVNVAYLNNSQTFTGANTFSNNITLTNGATIDNDEKIFNGYNNLQQIDVDNLAWRYLVVDSENRKDDYYTHNTGSSGDRSNVTVSRTGKYTIDYNTCFDVAAESPVTAILKSRLIRNGVNVLPGSLALASGDAAAGASICLSVITEASLTANDKVAIQVTLEDGGLGAASTQLANATSYHIRWTGI